MEMPVNWADLPALKPEDFTTVESFRSLRLSEEDIISKSLSDSDVKLTWSSFTARDGSSIPLLYYEPPDPTKPTLRPLLLMFHGGGFVAGDFTVEDMFCREAVRKSGALAVSIHYRLSPEHSYPTPLDDCEDALRHLLSPQNLKPFDHKRIVLGGSSAGANLACGVFQRVLVEYRQLIQGLLLNIPVTCHPSYFPDSKFSNKSWIDHASAPLLSAASMELCWNQYVPQPAVDPFYSPLLSKELKSFPPTAIICAEIDPLRDQGIALKASLEENGVPVKFKLYPGLPHGFHCLPLPEASDVSEEAGRYIKWMLGAEENGKTTST